MYFIEQKGKRQPEYLMLWNRFKLKRETIQYNIKRVVRDNIKILFYNLFIVYLSTRNK